MSPGRLLVQRRSAKAKLCAVHAKAACFIGCEARKESGRVERPRDPGLGYREGLAPQSV